MRSLKDNFCIDINVMSKKEYGHSLSRLFVGAQLAALIATGVDFIALLFFKEVIGLWYVTATALGAFMGACTNFLLGRYWVFTATESKVHHQAFRYILVSAGSLLLNTGGVYIVTEYGGINYFYSRVIVAILVAISYNFILQKNFVFK